MYFRVKQIENFISIFQQNLAEGGAVGESIEESKNYFKTEFDQIKQKSKYIQENMVHMKESVVSQLENKVKKCMYGIYSIFIKNSMDIVAIKWCIPC